MVCPSSRVTEVRAYTGTVWDIREPAVNRKGPASAVPGKTTDTATTVVVSKGIHMTSTMTSKNRPYATAATQARQATEKSADVFRNSAKAFTDRLDVATLPKVDVTGSVNRYFTYLQMAVDFNRDLATRWAELVTTMWGSYREQAHEVTGIVKDQTDKVAELTVKQAQKLEQAAMEQAEKLEQAAMEQAEKLEQAAKEQAEKLEQAEKAEKAEARRVEREKATKIQQRAEEAEEAEKAKAREAQRVEREAAKKAEEAEEAEKAKAREAKRVEREEAKKAEQQAREAYDGLTKAELSDQLAGRGLPKTGNVADLIERLVSADTQ